MADVSNGGRIVPIVTPDQPLPRVQEIQQINENAKEQQSEQQQEQQQQPKARKTRNKLLETAEVLEIPCLNELRLYALPTEGDGKQTSYT